MMNVFGELDGEFEIELDDNGNVRLTMVPVVAAALAATLDSYNDYRIKDGINRDSGWHDVSVALRQIEGGGGP